LQIRLDDYFKEIGCSEAVVSKQAFSKARTKLDPDVVKESFLLTVQTLCSCNGVFLNGASKSCVMKNGLRVPYASVECGAIPRTAKKPTDGRFKPEE